MGSVELSQLEPQIERTVIATLTDPDGGITTRGWQWYRGGMPSDGDDEAGYPRYDTLTLPV